MYSSLVPDDVLTDVDLHHVLPPTGPGLRPTTPILLVLPHPHLQPQLYTRRIRPDKHVAQFRI